LSFVFCFLSFVFETNKKKWFNFETRIDFDWEKKRKGRMSNLQEQSLTQNKSEVRTVFTVITALILLGIGVTVIMYFALDFRENDPDPTPVSPAITPSQPSQPQDTIRPVRLTATINDTTLCLVLSNVYGGNVVQFVTCGNPTTAWSFNETQKVLKNTLISSQAESCLRIPDDISLQFKASGFSLPDNQEHLVCSGMRLDIENGFVYTSPRNDPSAFVYLGWRNNPPQGVWVAKKTHAQVFNITFLD
jgi:hypothetical protein